MDQGHKLIHNTANHRSVIVDQLLHRSFTTKMAFLARSMKSSALLRPQSMAPVMKLAGERRLPPHTSQECFGVTDTDLSESWHLLCFALCIKRLAAGQRGIN